MNENPIAAADQYKPPADAVDLLKPAAAEGVSDQPAKPMDTPDSKEAHEYRSDWNQDDDATEQDTKQGEGAGQH